MIPLTIAHAGNWWPFGGDTVDYTIDIAGADDEMRVWFTKLKLDVPTDVNPPKNLDELDQEANALAGRIKKALDAKGYVESQAEPRLDRNIDPPVVHIQVEQGPRYAVSAIRVEWHGEALQALDMTTLRSNVQAPLDMEWVEADAQTLTTRIAKDSCLLSLKVTPKIRLFNQSHAAEIVFTVDHGARAHFGSSIITGNAWVHDAVIARGETWKQGECFDGGKVEATRTALIQNQLFSTVAITPGTVPDAKGEVPMAIAVKERAERTVGAGADYSTDDGFGIHGSWEHRNLWGDAQKLTTTATLAQRLQKLDGNLRIPAWQRDDQTLTYNLSLDHEDTDAYDAFTFNAGVGVERHFTKHTNAGTGLGYTLSNTDDEVNGINNYALISLPSFIEYDIRDNALDARKGVFARFSATPYTETVGDGGQFLRLLATGQSYLSSDEIHFQPTVATRLSVGSILGAKGDNVPADIRYYAGGGGSVRGYSYQSLSPYTNGKPAGGSSLLEGSAELRLKFTPTLGGVVFADAGNAYADTTPDLSQKFYYGAGVGARYYSPLGPLRFDVAFPLNGSDIGQTGFQIYVSLGQSF